MLKTISLRVSMLILAISIAFSVATLITPVQYVFADGGGGWVGCDDGNPDPGNRSGCSVSFNGTIQSGEGCFGVYTYTCSGQQTVCVYRYGNNIPCELIY
jgi:hypothetical protein